MPNMLLHCENEKFREDIISQITLYIPDFNINPESGVPDIIVIDEDEARAKCLKGKHPHTPIMVLLNKATEKPNDTALVKYYAKPIQLNKFINTLQAAINLAANSEAGKLSFNKYELRPLSKEILNRRNGDVTKLTEKEVAIIQYLYKVRGRVVTKPELLQEVWGYNPDATTHTIETHIYRLRQKVEHEDTEAQLIMTEDGGYVLKK